jgi:anti-sigma factor RsiW
MLQRDRFELLSAYLDGEVTAAERRQVDDWLAHDEAVQRLHQRLVQLRHGFQNAAAPAMAQVPVEATLKQVMARVDRRSKRPVWVIGGLAAAGAVVSAGLGWLGGDGGLNQQFAHSLKSASPPVEVALTPAPPAPVPSDKLIASDAVMVAVDSSVFDMSGAGMTTTPVAPATP